MIDTGIFRHKYRKLPPIRNLQKFVWRGTRYSYHDGASVYSPHLFCYPLDNKCVYLSAEASLPKLLYNHNVAVLDQREIFLALEKLTEIASEKFGVFFNAFTAQVGRVDYCYNFSADSNLVHSYLSAATNACPKLLKRKILGKIETVEFFNSQRKIYLYNKERQIESLISKDKARKKDPNPALLEARAAASGLIRLESRFNNSVAVQRLLVNKLKLGDRTARTLLDLDIAKKVLNDALIQFELNKPIPSFDQRIENLRSVYKSRGNRFQQLLGFIELCKYYGQDNLIDGGFIKKSSYYKNLKDLRDADALIYTDGKSFLPPLSVR